MPTKTSAIVLAIAILAAGVAGCGEAAKHSATREPETSQQFGERLSPCPTHRGTARTNCLEDRKTQCEHGPEENHSPCLQEVDRKSWSPQQEDEVRQKFAESATSSSLAACEISSIEAHNTPEEFEENNQPSHAEEEKQEVEEILRECR